MNNNSKNCVHIDLYEDRQFFVKSNPTFSKILSTFVMLIKCAIVLFFSPLIIINYIYNVKCVKYIVKFLVLFFYILLICTLFIIIKNDVKNSNNNKNNKEKIVLELDYKDKIRNF